MIERHIITGEFPPDIGGVGAHTVVLAAALAQCGEEVHIWCRGDAGAFSGSGVTVHRELGDLTAADLRRVSASLDGSPHRWLVQWVPHAFGRRSMNIAFCRWLQRRAALGDDIDVIVHEPYLPFRGSPAAMAAAAVHRIMIMLVLRAAGRVWVVTPAWEPCLRPYAPKRELGFEWLPVSSTMPTATRAVRLAGSDLFLIGCFATGEPYAEEALRHSIVPLLSRRTNIHLLLLGRHSETLRAALAADGRLGPRIHATGAIALTDLAQRVLGCDAAVQPYADGVCARRTTAMAFLAHGCPLITTDGRFTEDSWRAGAVALVPSGMPHGLATATEHLVDNASERERLGDVGRELYASRFDVRHAAAALHATAA